MQRLARWTNLSETTYIFNDDKADFRLRIYTPDRELPFAGHLVVGSAHAAIESGIVDAAKPFTLRCGLGILPLRTQGNRVWVQIPPPKRLRFSLKTNEVVASLNGDNVIDPLVFDTGPVWMVARMESVEGAP